MTFNIRINKKIVGGFRYSNITFILFVCFYKKHKTVDINDKVLYDYKININVYDILNIQIFRWWGGEIMKMINTKLL